MTPTAGAGYLRQPQPSPVTRDRSRTRSLANSRSLAIAVSRARPYPRVVMLLNVDRMVRRTRSGLSGPVWMFGAGHL